MGQASYSAAISLVALAAWSGWADGGFPSVKPTRGEPWPAPQQMKMFNKHYLVDPAYIRFNVTQKSCPDLEQALLRYHKILSGMVEAHREQYETRGSSDVGESFDFWTEDAMPQLQEVEVFLGQGCQGRPMPQLGDDEQYLIKINSPDYAGKAQIVADSVWGVYRGLETFVQLIHFSLEDRRFHLPQCIIRDFPRYSHRGMLLDTSRHFLSMKTLKDNLDLMAQNKYNVFHWHIVDDTSFPFVSTTFPELSARGAYAPSMVYTVEDVEEVIEYARLRGIRVIPELDTPGHTQSWGPAQPGLLTTCFNTTTGKPDGNYGPIDPTRKKNYEFMQKLLHEVTSRFPDAFVHLGGDEVSFGFKCWLSNPNVQKWMQVLNISTAEQVESVYIQKLLKIVESLDTEPRYIIWQEVLDNNITVRPDTVVHVWKNDWEKEMDRITGAGYKTLLSSCWYLNRIRYGIDWPDLYRCDPERFNGTIAQKRRVLGGEACMWGEFVDDTNILPRTWPRAAAVAERLWSDKTVKSPNQARSRMEEHRCRLLHRGYPVEPANGPGFCP